MSKDKEKWVYARQWLGKQREIEHDASACIATLLAQQKENVGAAKGTDIVKLVHK